ncbi:MAG TPA: class I SAM-dependent methyltransferase [Candidatus Didemnitutus sp.]
MSNSHRPAVEIEIHPAGWRFSGAPTWIAGALHGVAVTAVIDVRARFGHRLILGLAHLRAPGARDPQSDSSVRFSFLLQPHRGVRLLTLEAQNASGAWIEFFSTGIDPGIAAPPAPALPALPCGEVISAALRLRLRHPSLSWLEAAERTIFPFVAEPLNAFPNAPLCGALEEPDARGRIQHGSLSVTGWLAHPGRRIARVRVTLDPDVAVDLPQAGLRRDVPAALPSVAPEEIFPFAGKIEFPAARGSPALLKVYVEYPDGETVLAFARRFVPRSHGAIDRPPPGVDSAAILRASWAVRSAARNHGTRAGGWLGAALALRRQTKSEGRYRGTIPNSHAPHAPSLTSAPIPPGLCRDISPGDDMWGTDANYYFRMGHEAASLIQRVAGEMGLGQSPSILDLPCGHGRVSRWLRAGLPGASLTACDLQADGVAFCAEHLGARGVIARADESHWASLDEKFDIIWCGSLLTHLAEQQWTALLDRFFQRLKPGGALIVTTHGLVAFDLLCTGEKDYGLDEAALARLRDETTARGFGFAGYREQPDYGISMSHPGWVAEFLSARIGLRVREFLATGWGGHQDIFVCRRSD